MKKQNIILELTADEAQAVHDVLMLVGNGPSKTAQAWRQLTDAVYLELSNHVEHNHFDGHMPHIQGEVRFV